MAYFQGDPGSSLILCDHLIGVPLALAEYRQAQFSAKSEREQALREYKYQNYHFLDEKYLEFLKLCFDNPDLDIFDIPDNKIRTGNISSEDKKKELIAFSILFSVMERAFLMFYESSDKMKQRQWRGWDAYIHAFARRRNFREMSGRPQIYHSMKNFKNM